MDGRGTVEDSARHGVSKLSWNHLHAGPSRKTACILIQSVSRHPLIRPLSPTL